MANTNSSNKTLTNDDNSSSLKDAEALALEALDETEAEVDTNNSSAEDETKKSNDFAKTLQALEKVIEAKANKLMLMKEEAREKREMINNVFENDVGLQEAEEKKAEVQTQLKERKSSLNESLQVRQLREDLKEMTDEQKDLEESLSNHLINYHQLTNSTSFDTSDGDQWEFDIKAKVKAKKLK